MTATPELKVNSTLPGLSFNFEQLKEWATDLAGRYANIVVTEEAIADVKRDMAEINKAAKKVDDARKATTKLVSEPIRTFEAQIKEVIAIFDKAYSQLGSQVKVFEDAQREAKRKEVEGLIIEANMNAFGNPAELDIPIQEKWLNKTTSFKSIRDDLAAIIQRHCEDKKRKQELEQARQDRAASIENYVKTLNREHGYELPLCLFMTDSFLDAAVSIADVFKRIDNYFSLEKEKLEQQARKAAAAQKVPPASMQTKPASVPAKTRAMSIVLEFEESNEARITACLENLKSLCVSFGARQR